MEMDREAFIEELLALELLAWDLYANARYHTDEAMYWPVGSPERDICMVVAVDYQNEAKRISDGVRWRRLALVEGNTI